MNKRKYLCIAICGIVACVLVIFFNLKNINKEQISEDKKSLKNIITEEIDLKSEILEEQIIEEDLSEYFNNLNGSAVLYDESSNKFVIYNLELATTQRSPCSTFKIISSIIALENGIIDISNSTRKWTGEKFWNDEWNRDINFNEAFRTSCVWYYRKIIDEIGNDLIQNELNRLQYGNCDISDWKGELNTNNNNRALTGFWIESSLKISPKEQTEVMKRIFGNNTEYSEDTKNSLKEVMLVTDKSEPNISIYGKTGMGKDYGIVVDAWFTGFAENTKGKIYFCVYLGESKGMNVSSSKAKEIAIKVVSDYCKDI